MKTDTNIIDFNILEDDDRITAYLKGQMTDKEEQLFIKELNENRELREKAIATARLVKGLKQVGKEQDKAIMDSFLATSEQGLKNVLKDVTKDIVQGDDEIAAAYAAAVVPRQPKKPQPSNTQTAQNKARIFVFPKATKWLAAAASVICIVWLGVGYNNYRNTTGLGAEYDDVFTSSIYVRGANYQTESEKKLEKLFNDVKENKHIDEVIHDLNICWEISLMESYNDYTDYSAEIGWNLAIAYLKNNDRNGAKKVLKRLIKITEKSSAISQKSNELLRKIK